MISGTSLLGAYMVMRSVALIVTWWTDFEEQVYPNEFELPLQKSEVEDFEVSYIFYIFLGLVLVLYLVGTVVQRMTMNNEKPNMVHMYYLISGDSGND